MPIIATQRRPDPEAWLCSVPPRRSGHAGCHQRRTATDGAPLNDKIKWQRRRAAVEECEGAPGLALGMASEWDVASEAARGARGGGVAAAWRVPSRRTSASARLGASHSCAHRLRVSFLRVETTPPTSMARLMKAKYSAVQRMATLISVGSLSASQKRAVNVICTGRLSAGRDDQCVRD